MRYVGLTDDLEQRKKQHGNPPSFKRVRTFRTEKAAREWEKEILKKGYEGDTGGKGWKYGYTYTVTRKRKK
ncbi:MAG: hypothetical protein KAW87_04375 [Candidatus Cloacimonetes bacterium]|nr:hypothetical protein [Candidatus Cloacimonadota bacterium]